MNLSLLPFSLTAVIPVFIFVGLGAVPALSLITILGVAAMMLRDYRPEPTYHRKLGRHRCQQSLPLAS